MKTVLVLAVVIALMSLVFWLAAKAALAGQRRRRVPPRLQRQTRLMLWGIYGVTLLLLAYAVATA